MHIPHTYNPHTHNRTCLNIYKYRVDSRVPLVLVEVEVVWVGKGRVMGRRACEPASLAHGSNGRCVCVCECV